MAERTTEQRGALPAAYALDDDRNPALSKKVFDPEKRLQPGNLSLLGEIVAVFNPFRQWTTELQSAGITASLVVLAYLQLVDGLQADSEIVVEMPLTGASYLATSVSKPVSELDTSVKRIVAQARVDMIKRFLLRRMLPLTVATCLDPRMKNLTAFGVPAHISKKARKVTHQQMDRTITALKKAGLYPVEGQGVTRGADGHPKTAGSVTAQLYIKAKQCKQHLPVGAVPPTVGPGLESALDFHDVELENGVEVASKLTTHLSKELADMGKGKPGTLDLWWELHEECPTLNIVALYYLCIPASSAGVNGCSRIRA